jgi:hypothetical protein
MSTRVAEEIPPDRCAWGRASNGGASRGGASALRAGTARREPRGGARGRAYAFLAALGGACVALGVVRERLADGLGPPGGGNRLQIELG